MLKVIERAGIESAGKMDKDRWVFFKGSIRIEIERKAEIMKQHYQGYRIDKKKRKYKKKGENVNEE